MPPVTSLKAEHINLAIVMCSAFKKGHGSLIFLRIGFGVVKKETTMKTQILLRNNNRVSLNIEFEWVDYFTLVDEKDLVRHSDIYYEWCELKTETLHNLITEPFYRDHVFNVCIVDHPYEFKNEFFVHSKEK